MKIVIKDFYSLKNVEFEIEPGVTVISGKNGSGKTQLLAALSGSSQNGIGGLAELGLEMPAKAVIKQDPAADTVLFRPALRRNGEDTRSQRHVKLHTGSEFRQAQNRSGYVFNFDMRYRMLHHRVCHIFITGSVDTAEETHVHIWKTLTESFKRVFNKTLSGTFAANGDGACVGILLSPTTVSKFGEMSTGELEFISLLCDLLTESDVQLFLIDEIDVHFHPDLQRALIKEIAQLCPDKFVIATAQSPSVMLGADPERSFFLRHFSEVGSGANQITQLASDLSLIESLSEMYGGFAADARIVSFYQLAGNAEILKFADECTKESEPREASVARDYEPQNSSVRSSIMRVPAHGTVVDYGVGRGRLLHAFRRVDREHVRQLKYIAVDLDDRHKDEVQGVIDTIGLVFEDYKFHVGPQNLTGVDLTFLANVVHEATPPHLPRLLTEAIRNSKPGAAILILELLELSPGEQRFVVLDALAYRDVLGRSVHRGAVDVVTAEFRTHSNIPLLEVLIAIKDPKLAVIENDDVDRALQGVIDRCAEDLALAMTDGPVLSALPLAFKSHNIANATAFRRILGRSPSCGASQ